jgi:hypothetical protein
MKNKNRSHASFMKSSFGNYQYLPSPFMARRELKRYLAAACQTGTVLKFRLGQLKEAAC